MTSSRQNRRTAGVLSAATLAASCLFLSSFGSVSPAHAAETEPGVTFRGTETSPATATVWMGVTVVVRDVEDPTKFIPGATLTIKTVQPALHGTSDACGADNATTTTESTDQSGGVLFVQRASNFHSGHFAPEGDPYWGYHCVILDSLPEGYEPVGFTSMEEGDPVHPEAAELRSAGASLPFELLYSGNSNGPFSFTTTFWAREKPGEVDPEEPKVVLPVAPVLEDAQCDAVPEISIPEVEGVEYAKTSTADDTVAVTATPKEGYVFQGEQSASWTFDVSVTPCDEEGEEEEEEEELPLTPPTTEKPSPEKPGTSQPEGTKPAGELAQTGFLAPLPLVSSIVMFLIGAGAATKKFGLLHK